MEHIRTLTYHGRETYGRLRNSCRPMTEATFEANALRDIPDTIWEELVGLNLIEVTRTATQITVRLIKRDQRNVYHYTLPEYEGGQP